MISPEFFPAHPKFAKIAIPLGAASIGAWWIARSVAREALDPTGRSSLLGHAGSSLFFAKSLRRSASPSYIPSDEEGNPTAEKGSQHENGNRFDREPTTDEKE
ncbi:MAG TPA: hypothetical protein VF345_02435 [Chthoniobacterales bacterium]